MGLKKRERESNCSISNLKKASAKTGVKVRLINNVTCFVQWNLTDSQCEFMVHSKLRPQPMGFVVPFGPRGVRDFDLEQEMQRLQILIVSSEELEAEEAKSLDESDDPTAVHN